jgi:hypothetical protein
VEIVPVDFLTPGYEVEFYVLASTDSLFEVAQVFVPCPAAAQAEWIAIMASLPTDQYLRTEAEDELQTYAAATGLDLQLLLSDTYGSLNPGYWVIYASDSWIDSEPAAGYCNSVQNSHSLASEVLSPAARELIPICSLATIGYGSHSRTASSLASHSTMTAVSLGSAGVWGRGPGRLDPGPRVAGVWVLVGFAVQSLATASCLASKRRAVCHSP